MKIKVKISSTQPDVYIIDKDTEKLKAILEQYNIEIPKCCYTDTGRLLFSKSELNKIERQYKLARKKENESNKK